MTFRFLHTADIHLDSPLRSLALRDQEIADVIGNATRQAFVRMVDLCLEEKLDALLIAGDLYDGDLRSMKTAIFFGAQMRRLAEAGVRAFIVRGNHDAESRLTKQLSLPAQVHVFGGRAEAIEVPEKDIAIHGVSFAEPKAPESLLPKFKAPLPGLANIGLLHTSLAGAEGHDTYAPCSQKDLFDHGFDYWALGHVHKREVYNEGRRRIVMPGMPQGRHIGEAGPKSATLVTLLDDGGMTLEERRTAIAEFVRLPLDVTGTTRLQDVLERMETALRQARQEIETEQVVARIDFNGKTPLAGRLRRDKDMLHDEARQMAEALTGTAVEKLTFDVARQQAQAVDQVGDPLADLRRLIDAELRGSESFRAEVHDVIASLQKNLPPEVRESLLASWPDSPDKEDLWERHLVDQGSADVLARLEAGEQAD